MNPKFLPFTRQVAADCTEFGVRSQMLPYVVAMAVSKTLPIPSSPVEEVSNYFRVTHGVAIRNIISEINEVIVFDTPVAVELTRQLWELRYNAAHPIKLNMLGLRDANGVSIFGALCGASLALAPEQIMFMEKHSCAILSSSECLYGILSAEVEEVNQDSPVEV